MGSKKTRNRRSGQATPPPAPSPSGRRWVLYAAVVAIGAGLLWTMVARQGAAPTDPAGPEGVASAAGSDATGAALPPLPSVPYPLPRPPEVVQAVYHFAAQHPEVMSYVPCYCGCERSGHRDNEDCFVSSRDADGRVTWNAHGLG